MTLESACHLIGSLPTFIMTGPLVSKWYSPRISSAALHSGLTWIRRAARELWRNACSYPQFHAHPFVSSLINPFRPCLSLCLALSVCLSVCLFACLCLSLCLSYVDKYMYTMFRSFIHPLNNSFIHSFTRSFVRSFNYSSIYSVIHICIYSISQKQ